MRSIMLLIVVGLMSGCTSSAEPNAKPHTQHSAKARTTPTGVIALDGVRFGMPLKDFRPLFKIRKELKKGKDFNIALAGDTLVLFSPSTYLGRPVQGASATFYDGHLVRLAIDFRKSELPFFLQAMKKRLGMPKKIRLTGESDIAQFVWNLKSGEMVKIYPIREEGPFIELASASYAHEFARRVSMEMKAQLANLSKRPAYTAVFTCLVQNRRTRVAACLIDSYIKVSAGGKTQMYTPMDFIRAGYEQNIELTEHFHILAQNSARSRYMFLKIVIRDRLDRVVFEDMATAGGWINVGN